MKYTLTKESSPGFTFTTQTQEHVAWLLRHCICGLCTYTQSQWNNRKGDEDDADLGPTEDGINPYTVDPFFPENFSQLPLQEQIDMYLRTPCGWEYWLDEEEEKNDEQTV